MQHRQKTLVRAIEAFNNAQIYREPYRSRYLQESWYWLFMAVKYGTHF